MFREIESELGAEATRALRQYYSLFDERYYLWMANLYDPGEYDEDGNPIGGGYYFSNSGRDTAGYGIDLESTHQALQLLGSTGMLVNYGDDLGKALREVLPEKMQKEIIAFVQSLQSPEDGYFYHPQWEAVSISRRGRDLDWATKLLGYFGASPLWDTPNGVKGTNGAPGASGVSYLTGKLSGSRAVAVSAVISASAEPLPNELKSLSNFKAYLDSKTSSMPTSSYSIGNEIGAISSQIVARGEDYIKAFESWANSLQNESNGLWESGIHYSSVNGLMKLSGTYNSLGIKFNYADVALESALKMILHEGEDTKGKEAKNSVDVWNPFCAVTNLMDNIEKFGDKRINEAFLAKTRGMALEIIKVTTEKNARFKKLDGSFGYSVGATSGTSQGAPVAVAGTDEGDINGGNIAVTGVSNYMCRILGIDVVPIYYPTDLEKYLDTINELTPVLKDDAVIETEPIHFDDDPVGSSSPGKISVQAGSGSVLVVEDPREDREGNVLEFITKKGAYSAIGTSPAASRSAGCYYLGFDICIAEANSSSTAFQIKMGKSYMFTIAFKDGAIVLGDSSDTNGQIAVAQSFGSYFNIGEWANVRIEYYAADEEASVRTKIYVNGTLVAISDNYVGHPQSGEGTPTRDFGYVEFYGLQNSDMTVYFDDLLVKRVDKRFDLGDGDANVKWFVTNSEYDNVYGYLGTGKYAENAKTEKYTGVKYDGISGEAATSKIIPEGANDILRLEKLGAESAVASFLSTKMCGPVYIAETDIKWIAPKKTSEISYFKLALASETYKNGGTPIAEIFGIGNSDGTLSLKLAEDGDSIGELRVSRWQNLRVEIVPSYTVTNGYTLSVYLDGQEVVKEVIVISDEVSLTEYCGFALELADGALGYGIDLDNTYVGVAVTTAHPDINYSYSSSESFDNSMDGPYVTEKALSGFTVGDYISLSQDPCDAANNVIKAQTPANAEKEYLGYTIIKNSSGNNEADAVYSSFSAKVFFETNGDTKGGRVARIIFKDSSYAFGIDVFVTYNSRNSSYSLKMTHYNVGSGGFGGMDTLLDGVNVIDQWFELRIDYCKCGTSSVLSVYINGECYAKDVVGYYSDKITDPGVVKELEWRYIRSGITTYLDDVAYECMIGDVTIDYGTEETPEEPETPTDPDTPGSGNQPTNPDAPTDPDTPTNPDDGLGGTENPDKDGTDKDSSMPDDGWVE